MSEEPDLTEQLLDLMVYIPIGLALEARELLPKLAERGRGQVNLVRFAGKVASSQGESQSRSVFDQLVATVGTLITGPPSKTPDGPPTRESAARHAGETPDLPIDGYDSLSAPQLLPYLDPLDESQLADVLAYEEDHRSRATVINRIKQLQA